MITYLKISGFKSFTEFEMSFTPFTVVAGTNASGKSNLFDALQLLSDLSHGDLRNAFTNQRGAAIELFTQYDNDSYSRQMTFLIEMLVDKHEKDSWGGRAILKYTRLRYSLSICRRNNEEDSPDELYIENEKLEALKHQKDDWLKINIPKNVIEDWRPKVKGRRGKPYIYTELKNNIPTIKLPQDGRRGGKETRGTAVTRTVLSGIDDVEFPHAFAAREEMKNWKFLQLNPEELRKPTKKEIGFSDIIGQGGENLAAALFRLHKSNDSALAEISRKVNSLLPNLVDVCVYDDKVNNQYIIKVTSEDGKQFSSRVLSEGTLRILTLCVFLYDDMHQNLLCYEEPENGIHPFRIANLTRILNDLSVDFNDSDRPLRQILINTHSTKLVGEIVKWQSDNRVSIWFSSLNTRIASVEGERRKLSVTKVLPVVKEEESAQKNLFPQLNITEAEIKLTLSQVKRYLETTDQEQSKNDV